MFLKYIFIKDIQKILLHFFKNLQRPKFIKLSKLPKSSTLILIKKNKDFKFILKKFNFTVFILNEGLNLKTIFNNILNLYNTETSSENLINIVNLNLIEKQNILHLFSYNSFIKSKIVFDIENFNNYTKPNKVSKYFIVSIDCEMLDTVKGREIGRVSVVDHNFNVILDKFCRPENRVLDYLTEYSGLTKENTEKGENLENIKNELLDIIGTNTFVLGHGLEHDFEALNFYTENVIDTSYLFLNHDGYKVKLKKLTKIHFNDVIQKDSHDSVVDALACMRLLNVKISQYYNFINTNIKILDNIKNNKLKTKIIDFLEVDDVNDIDFNIDLLKNFKLIFYEFDNNKYIAFKTKNEE